MTVIRLVLARLETGALLSALAVASIFALWTTNFLSLESITSILMVTSESAILAIAVTLLMIAGEFDLSVGSVLGLSSVVVPLMMVNYQVPPLAAVMIAFAIAIGIGLLHGTIVRGLRIPSFIVTLGGLLFWRGIVFVITQGFPVRVPRGSGSLFDFFSYRFPNGFDVSLVWLIAWALVFYVLLTQTGFGNWIYASGANERAARAMGVPVDRVRTILFVFTSVSTCLAGLIQVGRFGSVDATRGQGLELEVIAASVIGGTSLSGGVGSIGGTILGCLIIGMIRNGLAIAGISSYWYTAIIGLLIVAAVLVNKATERFRKGRFDMSDPETANLIPLLEVRNIKKSFGRVRALDGVSFTVDRRSVVGLLGDNGAGKSTLIRILNGIYSPDAGEILWNGRAVHLRSPRDASNLGFATVYQDLAMIDQLSIYRNMFIGREKNVTWKLGPFRFLNHKRAKRETSAALAALGIKIKSTETAVEALSGGQRQSIAIARAVHFGGELLILDEPTSALSLRQTKQVLETIEKARERGISVVFISHNIGHVFEVADRFVVLSHGQTVANLSRVETDENQVSHLVREGRAVER